MSTGDAPDAPPPLSFFDGERPRLGDRSLGIVLGDVRLLLCGLDSEVEERLDRRYGPFRASGLDPDGTLRVDVLRDERDYFIEPPPTPESNRVVLACEGMRVRYMSYRAAGWFDTGPGRGQLVVARGSFEPADRAVENYIRAATAWLAASRGGALVHAASAVLDGAGYLFYGESGAGKSTLAASNRRARIVSDDLSLVLPGPAGRLELVGGPFRGTWSAGQPVTGRFPLAAGFRIVKDSSADVRAVPRARALAELVGNLPFVAEAFGARPDLFDALERAFAAVPLGHLHFTKDDSFWDAVARADLAR